MRPRRRLWVRLLASHLAVVVVGSGTVLVAVGVVAPGAFDTAMGHATIGLGDMGDMMSGLVRTAFREAVQTALVIAVVASGFAAIIVSIALATRLSRPISRLADASRRIAAGRYAERVQVSSDDEIGELAVSYNTMADSLEETERRRLQLVGDVAHELRTPLATLDGYLEGLQDGIIVPEAPTWHLLRSETARLSRLVNDLQELWRAEARQLPLTVADVDVEDQLRAAAERFAKQARDQGIEIRTRIGLGRLFVRADRDRLGQVLDNFVTNAIRHSPKGGQIILSADRDRDEVTIAVADQGPGLTVEQIERVFERFYRVDPSRSRALGGSGIGLAISRALADAMGGRVDAVSEGPGHGTTFLLVLPAA
ncbi:MAG: ATP-binding protein [Candidatus Limnocylindrales bacterium]